MTEPARPHLLRAVVYGGLALAIAGVGCDLRGCSCEKLPRGVLVKDPPEAAWTDVEMLAEGVEPKVVLRVARWTGLRYRFVIESAGSLGLEGQPAPFGPTVILTAENDVVRGSADPAVERRDGGIVRLVEERSVVESVAVRHEGTPKAVIDAWNLALAPLRGTTFRQGITESAGVDWIRSETLGDAVPPEAVRASVDATLDAQKQFPFRLPPVAVGVGARWRFRKAIVVNGVQAVQVADMTLKGIDPSVAVVGIVLRQEALPQDVPHPFVPGEKAHMDQFRGDGEGELTVDRLTGIVLRGRLVGTARLTLSGRVGDQQGSLTVVGGSLIQAQATILDDGDAGGQVEPEGF